MRAFSISRNEFFSMLLFSSFKYFFESFFSSVFSVQTVFCGWAAVAAMCVYVFVHIHIGNWFYFYSASKQSTVYLTCHAYSWLSQVSYLMIYANHCLSLHVSQRHSGLIQCTLIVVPPNGMHSPNNRFGEKHLLGSKENSTYKYMLSDHNMHITHSTN